MARCGTNVLGYPITTRQEKQQHPKTNLHEWLSEMPV